MKPILLLMVITTWISNLLHAQTVSNNYTAAASTFQKTFKDVANVEWTTTSDLYKAKFDYNGRSAYAFFNAQGELVCIGRSTSMQQIPPMLQLSFQNKYSGYTISNVLEVSTEGGTSYYVTIIKNEKKIILKSSGMEHWFVFSKTKNTIKFTE